MIFYTNTDNWPTFNFTKLQPQTFFREQDFFVRIVMQKSKLKMFTNNVICSLT